MTFVDPHPPTIDLDESQALIEEARNRQRRRRRFITALVSGVLFAGVFVAVAMIATSGSGPTSTTGGFTGQAVPAGVFAQTWSVHKFSLHIGADGRGAFRWTIHVTCGSGRAEGPPPCDRILYKTLTGPNGQGVATAEIIGGGRAALVLTRVGSTTARGVIEGSTQPSVVPNGPVSLTVTQHDLLVVSPATPPTDPSPFKPGAPLCGVRAKALSDSQRVAEGINCGA
jgi:hypothetical protein